MHHRHHAPPPQHTPRNPHGKPHVTQHGHNKPHYPNHPAPSSDMQPEKKSRFAQLRERFTPKPPTPEDVARLKLESEKEKYKYDKKYYQTARRKIGGSMILGGGQSSQTRRPVGRPPFRQQGGFGMGSSLLESNPLRGSGETWGTGINSLLGSNSQQQKRPVGRPKMQSAKKPFGSGLNDLFSI